MAAYKFKKETKNASLIIGAGDKEPLVGAIADPQAGNKLRIRQFNPHYELTIDLDTDTVEIDADGGGYDDVTADGNVAVALALNNTVLFKDEGSVSVTALEYVALLSQSGTDAPVATVIKNTLGGTVVWTRDALGQYIGTLAGAFVDGKTVILTGSTAVYGSNITAIRESDNEVRITTWVDEFFVDHIDPTPVEDEPLNNTSIHISVYP